MRFRERKSGWGESSSDCDDSGRAMDDSEWVEE